MIKLWRRCTAKIIFEFFASWNVQMFHLSETVLHITLNAVLTGPKGVNFVGVVALKHTSRCIFSVWNMPVTPTYLQVAAAIRCTIAAYWGYAIMHLQTADKAKILLCQRQKPLSCSLFSIVKMMAINALSKEHPHQKEMHAWYTSTTPPIAAVSDHCKLSHRLTQPTREGKLEKSANWPNELVGIHENSWELTGNLIFISK